MQKPSRPKTREPGAFPPVSPTSATNASVPISINALRPVLPRPSLSQSSGDLCASLVYPHPHNHRFSHGSAFFSPYGRAYEEHHYSSEESHTGSFAENGLATHRSSDLMAWSSDSSGHSIPQKAYPPCCPELRDDLDSPESMIPPSPPFEDVSKADTAHYPIFDLPRIVEPMPITLVNLPDVFHEPTSQCICVGDQRMRIDNYCMRCQRRCDDHEPGGDQSDLLTNSFPGERSCCIPSDVPMLSVPPPRSRASSTSSVASDLSSLYPPSIEDASGGAGAAVSLLPLSLSRVRRMALDMDMTSPLVGDGAGPAYAMSFHSSAPDIAQSPSDSFDTSYADSISILF